MNVTSLAYFMFVRFRVVGKPRLCTRKLTY